MLEQRIGRLVRIGQKETIHLHVPFLPNSHQAVLARCYHEASSSGAITFGSDEVSQLIEHRNALAETLANAQLRRDAIRVIQSS